MSFRTRLLFSLPLIAILAVGCSETTSSTSKTAITPPVVKGKTATGKRKPKDMGALTGPEGVVE